MYTRVSDLSTIVGLADLRKLWLDGTPVSNFLPISDLTSLEELSLSETNVSDVSWLARLSHLQKLWLSDTQISDLSPIVGLTALQGLSLGGTPLSDLSPVAGLTALQILLLDKTPTAGVSDRRGLIDLESLSLDDTRVTDLSPIARTYRLDSRKPWWATVGAVFPTPTRLLLENRPSTSSCSLVNRHAQSKPSTKCAGNKVCRRTSRRATSGPQNFRMQRIDAPPRKPAELAPPSQPLPTPGPATRFGVVGGRIDIVPAEIWKDQKEQAAAYHARACKLAAALAERLSKTDAVPDVAASVAALGDVLGDSVENVQPDQLRLASRSIAARARAYGHPAAQWEISPDAVSAIFELADLLVDLQAFAKTDIEANERAIRQLDLSPTQAAAAKVALDEITSAIATIPEVVTERVETTFANAAILSQTSIETDVKTAVEGERILLTENLALSVARSIGGSGGGKPPAGTERQPEKPEKPKKRPQKPTAPVQHAAWDDFKDRLLKRLQKKAPEEIADAALHAVVSTIKHSPKTIAGLGAALVLWSASYPIIIGSSLAVTVAWIRYELAKRHQSKD